jgi:hypothetical protein
MMHFLCLSHSYRLTVLAEILECFLVVDNNMQSPALNFVNLQPNAREKYELGFAANVLPDTTGLL